ncbi:MAG: YmdB family metallophosphoesterase [Candidatus Rifleibacteriota bacterium]
MFAIVFIGVVMHELPYQQFKALVTAVKAEAGAESMVVCNANGLFASAPRLGKQVELIFDSGIELIFLGEQAVARNSGRRVLEQSDLPLLRPINLSPGVPGFGKKLITMGEDCLWLISLTDQSNKSLVNQPHEILDDFISNKNDSYPVFISMNGSDPDYKKAIAWKYSNCGFSVVVAGTGLNYQTADINVTPDGNAFLADVGMVASKDSIAGVSPQTWWKKHIERSPVSMFPDNSPVVADYAMFYYQNSRISKAYRNRIEL